MQLTEEDKNMLQAIHSLGGLGINEIGELCYEIKSVSRRLSELTKGKYLVRRVYSGPLFDASAPHNRFVTNLYFPGPETVEMFQGYRPSRVRLPDKQIHWRFYYLGILLSQLENLGVKNWRSLLPYKREGYLRNSERAHMLVNEGNVAIAYLYHTLMASGKNSKPKEIRKALKYCASFLRRLGSNRIIEHNNRPRSYVILVETHGYREFMDEAANVLDEYSSWVHIAPYSAAADVIAGVSRGTKSYIDMLARYLGKDYTIADPNPRNLLDYETSDGIYLGELVTGSLNAYLAAHRMEVPAYILVRREKGLPKRNSINYITLEEVESCALT